MLSCYRSHCGRRPANRRFDVVNLLCYRDTLPLRRLRIKSAMTTKGGGLSYPVEVPAWRREWSNYILFRGGQSGIQSLTASSLRNSRHCERSEAIHKTRLRTRFASSRGTKRSSLPVVAFCHKNKKKQHFQNYYLTLHFYKVIENEHHYSRRRRSRHALGGGPGAQQP